MGSSSLKFLIAHLAVLFAVCYLATIKAPDQYGMSLLTGWFALFTMERLKNRATDSIPPMPFSTPTPVTRTIQTKG